MSSLKSAYGQITKTEVTYVLADMTLDGTPLTDNSMAVDGSVTPVLFFVQPPPGHILEIVDATINVSDAGNPPITNYGNVTGPLTNGTSYFLDDDELGFRLIGNSVMDNKNLVDAGAVHDIHEFAGNVTVKTYGFNLWQFSRSGVKLDGDKNAKLGITIRDDLTSMVDHSASVKGRLLLKSV